MVLTHPRQGCPISAYLFIVAADILAHKLRENKGIEGIKIPLTKTLDTFILFLTHIYTMTGPTKSPINTHLYHHRSNKITNQQTFISSQVHK